MNQLTERRIEILHQKLRESRIKNGIANKSMLEEALNSYINGNYMSAFINAYINLVTPIAINSKRLYKKKSMKKFMEKGGPFNFNLSKALEQCIFLDIGLKNQLSIHCKVTLQSFKSNKQFNKHLTITQIRNITMHPEDNLHKLLTEQLDYKSLACHLIGLALEVHKSYQNYFNNSSGKKKRKQREQKIYSMLVA